MSERRTASPAADGPPGPERASRTRGVRLQARSLSSRIKGGPQVLDGVSVAIDPGELVAIVGGSGAGKTTLLDALSGVRPADAGSVTFDGVDLYGQIDRFRSILGYVPQDDIIHTELPVARTLRYAARLRLAQDDGMSVEAAVADALTALDLTERATTKVAALSGGQRKRASIAVEMLTKPRIFFLDEPTSGLDPASGRDLLRVLRSLTDAGSTVVFTTHAVQDLQLCDRVVFLARGGRLVFEGTPGAALRHFGVSSVEEIYDRLRDVDDEGGVTAPPAAEEAPPPEPTPRSTSVAPPAPPSGPGFLTQWRVLTARTFETLARNTLTVAILVGSPAMVVAMFAILFQTGAFDPRDPSPTSILMIIFWVTFGSFFFGLTYGLLQIVTERAILRRERLVGLRIGPYLLSKVAVLLPFLVLVNVLMIVVLRALDRLPSADAGVYLSVGSTLTLGALAALTLGLLASASVRDPSQATLALPMLCFPAVLFSGAILPVHVMATAGRWISGAIPVRWAFEAVGRDLQVRELLLQGASPLGPPLVESYGSAGLDGVGTYWLYLAGFSVLFFGATWIVLARTAGRSTR